MMVRGETGAPRRRGEGLIDGLLDLAAELDVLDEPAVIRINCKEAMDFVIYQVLRFSETETRFTPPHINKKFTIRHVYLD